MTSTLPRTRSATLPPGPKLPVLAQTLLFANFRHRLLPYWRRRYGDVFTVRLYPGRNAVQLAGLDDIKAVFSGPVTTFHAGEGNVILKPIMGEHSVLLTDEDVHLRARKLLMPAFHGAALRGYRTMITELAEQEVSRWPAGQVFRSHERMQALTLEIILRVVFGVGEGARLDELRRLLTDLVDIGVLDLFGFHNEKLRSFGPWRRSRLLQERVDELLYAEIADRRAAPDLAERDDVLSRLLTVPAEDDRLSDAELRDQLVTLLLAGHETTATALAWSFHELARDPVRLRRALEAADSGDEKYLEAVAKEAMRLRPVISEVARRLTEEVEVGGYLLLGRDDGDAVDRAGARRPGAPRGAGGVPPGAVPGRRRPGERHVVPLRRRRAPLPGRGLLPAGGDDRAAGRAVAVQPGAGPPAPGGLTAAAHHDGPRAGSADLRHATGLRKPSTSARLRARSAARACSSYACSVTRAGRRRSKNSPVVPSSAGSTARLRTASTPDSRESTVDPISDSTIFVGMYVPGCRQVAVSRAGANRPARSKQCMIWASLLCP